jgi:hypothetical protein
MAAAIGLTVEYGIGIQKVYSVIDTFNPKDSKENATSNSSGNEPDTSVKALPSPCMTVKEMRRMEHSIKTKEGMTIYLLKPKLNNQKQDNLGKNKESLLDIRSSLVTLD